MSEETDEPLRALFLSHSASLSGGAQRSLLEVIEALRRDGRIDPVLATPTAGPLLHAARSAGAEATEVPAAMWEGYFFEGLGPRVMARRLRTCFSIARDVRAATRKLRDLGPGVVVTNTLSSPVGAVAARRLGVPHVWWAREFVTLDHGQRYLFGEKRSLRAVARLSTEVITVSDAVGRHLTSAVDPDRLSTVYPLIDVPPSAGLDPPKADEPLRVLVIGRLSKPKGQDVAIRAISIARELGHDLRLRLVGDVSDRFRTEIEELVAGLGVGEGVDVAGFGEALNELDGAHVVLVTSRCEAFGRVTAEALQRGRPVIGTRCGGTVELVQHELNGLLVEPGDPNGLADALIRLRTDPLLLARLVSGARSLGAGLPSEATAVDRIVQILRRASVSPEGSVHR